MAYSFEANLPSYGTGGGAMRDGDRSDLLAFVLVIAVFGALMIAIIGLGTDTPIPFLDRLK